MDTGLIMFICFAGIVLCGVIIYQILKYLKGSIKIKTDKNAYSSGEMITGSVYLKTKKAIQGNRLFIELVAQKKEKNVNGNTNSTLKTVYSQELNLEGEKQYGAGYSNVYNFQLKVPSSSEMGQPQIQNEILKTVVKIASVLTGGDRLEWYIEAKLDAEGIDLTSQKTIKINIADNSTNQQNTIQN